MRILYISSSNCMSGSSIALLNMVKGMKSLGHDVLVVTTKEDDYLVYQLKEIACPYIKLNITLDIYPLNKNIILYIPRLLWTIVRHYRGVRRLVKIIRDFHPDIVHTNVGPMSIGYDACRQLGIKHVWHQREYQDKDFGMYFLPNIQSFMRKSHDDINFNICITKGVFNYRHFRPEKDVVIYDAVFSDSQLPGLPKREVKNFILFVGRIEEAKGLYDVLTAYLDFHKDYPEMQLFVIGPTPEFATKYEQRCKQFVHDNKLDEHVSFLGRKSNVYEYMAQAKMMIVPSRFEGFGFITAEAMLNGCPVIGRDTAGTKEQFDNGVKYTGKEIGIRYTTHQELVKAIQYAMHNDLTEMCQRAKDTVSHLYTVERNIKNIEAFYKKVIDS